MLWFRLGTLAGALTLALVAAPTAFAQQSPYDQSPSADPVIPYERNYDIPVSRVAEEDKPCPCGDACTCGKDGVKAGGCSADCKCKEGKPCCCGAKLAAAEDKPCPCGSACTCTKDGEGQKAAGGCSADCKCKEGKPCCCAGTKANCKKGCCAKGCCAGCCESKCDSGCGMTGGCCTPCVPAKCGSECGMSGACCVPCCPPKVMSYPQAPAPIMQCIMAEPVPPPYLATPPCPAPPPMPCVCVPCVNKMAGCSGKWTFRHSCEGIQVTGPCLEGMCESLSFSGPDGYVVLEGHVRLKYEKDGHKALVTADKICVGMGDGHIQLSVASTPKTAAHDFIFYTGFTR